MPKNTPQTRTLYRALENCGGKMALAATLEVPVENLSRWLSGDDVTPAKIYLASLDLVAMGRLAKQGYKGDTISGTGYRGSSPRTLH